MSTTRITFTIESIREQIEAKYKASTAKALAQYQHDINLVARRDEWRADAEQRFRDITAGLELAPDNELESFSIASCPRFDRGYRSQNPEMVRDRALDEAETKRDRAIERVEAFKGSGHESVSLTPKMLFEWFGI